MPVNLLYCEGQAKSPDLRIIRTILRGVNCVVKPFGGKYGFGDKIRIAREFNTASVIAGLLDRDFDEDNAPPALAPRPWQVESNTLWLGWRWERKEIENYMIDPQVVRRAIPDLQPSDDEYLHALRNTAQNLAEYTAARTALSRVRPRFKPLGNDWGSEHGIARHKLPQDLSLEACREGIRRAIQDYSESQIVVEQAALQQFETYLPECQPGGQRFEHFLTFFAGKDLFCALDAQIRAWGIASYSVFKAKIIKGIEESQEDVWNWLPEWENLRQQIVTR